MNIRLIQSVIRRPALAIAAAAAMVATTGGYASAQSGLANPYAAGFGADTQVVPASAVPTAADVNPGQTAPGSITQALGQFSADAPGAVSQVGYGCQSCAQPGCNGGCNSYGLHGHGRHGHGAASPYGNPCGIPCDPYYYVNVEALYMERLGEGGFSLTRNVAMDDFDWEIAPRVTVGSLPNCVNGYEFTWVGPFKWERAVTAFDPGNNINSILVGGTGFDATFLDPFQDSTIQAQYYNSEYWSAEMNKTVVGWDVAKVLCGARFIRIEEDLGFAGQKDQFSTYADLTNSVTNSFFGLQLGLDLLYPLGRHLWTDFRGRAGAYIDFAESDTRLRNQGVTILSLSRDDDEIAGVVELGGGIRYQLGEMLWLRAGAEMWYISDVATSAGQIQNPITSSFATRVNIDDDLFYYGVTLGAELRF